MHFPRVNADFGCKMCGKCCITFGSQIRFYGDLGSDFWTAFSDRFPDFGRVIRNFNEELRAAVNKNLYTPGRVKKVARDGFVREFVYIPEGKLITTAENCSSSSELQQSKKYIPYSVWKKDFLGKTVVNADNLRFPFIIPRKIRGDPDRLVYIPTKFEYLASVLTERMKKRKIDSSAFLGILDSMLFTAPNLNGCLFLSDGESPYCTVYDFRPLMCRLYPSNKGYVCLNQKERYYTRTYLEFKKKDYADLLTILGSFIPLFRDHPSERYALDLFAFLVDFGDFPETEVGEFFTEKMGWSRAGYKYALKDLMGLGLVFGSFIPGRGFMIGSVSSSAILNKLENVS